MKARILGADRRLRSICKENQPTKIADWIGECLVLEEARGFFLPEKQQLSIAMMMLRARARD
jgi:hypothetical protein